MSLSSFILNVISSSFNFFEKGSDPFSFYFFYPLYHIINKPLGGRGAGGYTNFSYAVKPFSLQFLCGLHMLSVYMPRAYFSKPLCISAVPAANDQHQIYHPCQFICSILITPGRTANSIPDL